jgi:hypothetical protein
MGQGNLKMSELASKISAMRRFFVAQLQQDPTLQPKKGHPGGHNQLWPGAERTTVNRRE